MFPTVAVIFLVGYRYVRLATALAVVTSMAQRLVVALIPKVPAQADRGDVIHHLCYAPTPHT